MVRLAVPEDIEFISKVMNDPKVRPHILDGDGPVDVRPALECMWVAVAPGKGVMMAEALGDSNYLALVGFLPEFWGAEAIAGMREAIRLIFTTTDCHRLWGSVVPRNIRASRNLLGLGFKEVGLHGNRVTGYIDYLDLLDEGMFRDTVKAGWNGKALYWWGIKAKLEDIEPFVPLDPVLPVYSREGVVHDYLT